MTIEEIFRRAVTALKSSKLNFALAGGFAASVYRDEERFTKDVDFIIGGEGDLIDTAKKLISELGLKPHIARKADLDGGPLFAIKRGNTKEMVIIGRDKERNIPGIDLLLPANPWVPAALERAQYNQIDWGFDRIPTMTIEDVVVAKLISSANTEREQDVLDLRSIFRSGNQVDLVYVVAKMHEFEAVVPDTLKKDAPTILMRASKRVTREKSRRLRASSFRPPET